MDRKQSGCFNYTHCFLLTDFILIHTNDDDDDVERGGGGIITISLILSMV